MNNPSGGNAQGNQNSQQTNQILDLINKMFVQLSSSINTKIDEKFQLINQKVDTAITIMDEKMSDIQSLGISLKIDQLLQWGSKIEPSVQQLLNFIKCLPEVEPDSQYVEMVEKKFHLAKEYFESGMGKHLANLTILNKCQKKNSIDMKKLFDEIQVFQRFVEAALDSIKEKANQHLTAKYPDKKIKMRSQSVQSKTTKSLTYYLSRQQKGKSL